MSSLRTALAAVTTGLLAVAVLVAPGAGTAPAAEPVLTDFSLSANGYSTKARGGDVPARSDRTGYAVVACTRFAHRTAGNNTASARLPEEGGAARIGATTTRAFTDKQRRTVSSNSHNNVSRVLIGDTSSLGLEIEGIRTRARAWHNRSGFHRSRTVKVSSVTRYVAGVATEVVSIPSNQDLDGERLLVPGLATVTFGLERGRATGRSASARATGLRIELAASDSLLLVGNAAARIDGGAVAGIMGGSAWGSKVNGLGGAANSGRTALQPLPCVGTGGEFRTSKLAGARIPGAARLGEIVSRVKGVQRGGEASAKGIATISRAGFGDRRLVLKGIRAEGLVRRERNGSYTRHARGTTLGRIIVAGERQRIPRPGRTLVIPGVARITPGLVDRSRNGIRVTGVRVRLLDGSDVESTLHLGNVQLRVRRG